MAEMDNEGTKGIGCEGYSKYETNGDKAEKHGGNDAIHDGIMTEQSPYNIREPKTSDGIPGAMDGGKGSY